MGHGRKKARNADVTYEVETRREGDLMITVTTKTESAIVDYADIVAACEVRVDADYGPPWEEEDGWEHTLIDNVDEKSPWSENWTSVVESDAVFLHKSGWKMIVISRETLEEWQGAAFSPDGRETRQRYEERLAATRKDAISTLRKWYSHGWTYLFVVCEFKGHQETLGGVLIDDDPVDYPYLDEIKDDLADTVAMALEAEGYTVVNRPAAGTADRDARRADPAERYRAYIFGFDSVEAYRGWLASRPAYP